jgi:hypothetical protein
MEKVTKNYLALSRGKAFALGITTCALGTAHPRQRPLVDMTSWDPLHEIADHRFRPLAVAKGDVCHLYEKLDLVCFEAACSFDSFLASNGIACEWSIYRHYHRERTYSRPFALFDRDVVLDAIRKSHGLTEDATCKQQQSTVQLAFDRQYPVPVVRFVLPFSSSSPGDDTKPKDNHGNGDYDEMLSIYGAEPYSTFADLFGWLPSPWFDQLIALRSALRDVHHRWNFWSNKNDYDVTVAFPGQHEPGDPVQRLAGWVRAYARDQAPNGNGCVALTVDHDGTRPILCMNRFVIPTGNDRGDHLLARAAQIASNPLRADIAALYPHIRPARVAAFENIDIMMPIHHAPHRWAPMDILPPAHAERTPGRLSDMDGNLLLQAHNSAAMVAGGAPQRLVLQPEKQDGAFLWYWTEAVSNDALDQVEQRTGSDQAQQDNIAGQIIAPQSRQNCAMAISEIEEQAAEARDTQQSADHTLVDGNPQDNEGDCAEKIDGSLGAN